MKKTLFTMILAALSLSAKAQTCEIHLMVAPIEQGEEVSENLNDMLMTRLSQSVAHTGVVADPNYGQFFVTGKFNNAYKETLQGPPIQTALHSTLTLYIGDAVNQQVYATQSFDLRGVGTSEERAYINALGQLNGKNQKVQDFVEMGKKKILDYFNKNYPSILKKAQRAAAVNEYGEALYYVMSIPECCNGYGEAMSLMNQLFTEKLAREGKQLLQLAQSVYYADPSPRGAAEAMRYLAMIDPDSPVQGEAAKLAAEIKKNTKSDYDFETRQKYKDAISLEKDRIAASRAIGVAWGNGQKPTTTNLMFVR